MIEGFNRRRIGLFGGTFNPPHMGHMIIAQDAFHAFDLSKVVFIPCYTPPHKTPSHLASTKHRLAMLEAAIEDDVRYELSDIEIENGGASYSVDTARYFKKQYPDAELCFIIGTDSLVELYMWKDIEELLQLCRFITISRPGYYEDGIGEDALKLSAPWAQKLLNDVRKGISIDVSSSDVRYRIAEGMSVKYLVPRAVEMYMAEHNLYTFAG